MIVGVLNSNRAIDRAAQAIENSELPDDYARMLREGAG